MKKLKLFSLALMALFATSLWADTKTYNFNGTNPLSEWSVTTSAETGASYGVATNCAASSAHSFANDDSSTYGKYFWMYWGTKNIGVTAITTDSFDDITNITLDFAANDNSKPTITISVVASDESETVILNAGGLKNDFDNPGSDKWKRGKSFAVSNLSGKIKFYLIPSSSGKYAGLDNIVVTYTPAPATNYTITYDNNGGEGTMSNSTNIVSSCTFTAPTGKEFKEWNTAANGTGASYAPGATAPSNLDLFAIWQTKVEKYTVVYKDGETELGSEQVTVGESPAGIATPSKDFYTFAAWSPALSSVSGNDGDEVEVNATWTGQYTSGTYEFTGHLTMGSAPNQMVIENNSDGKDYSAGRIDNIYVSAQKIGYEATGNYGGWKLKTTNGTLRFMVENACGVRVTLGEANPLRIAYTEGGVAKTADIAKSTTSSFYKADANTLVTLTNITSGNKTVTLKKIEILPLYSATYTTSKSSVDPTSASNVTEVTLPTPAATTVDGYNFTGWKADQAVTVGGETKAVGTLLSAGDVAVLGANTTFTAQWVLIEYFDVKFFQGYGEPNAQIGETQSISTGNHAEAPATDPERAGYVFKGWSYDATEAHIVDVASYTIMAATNFNAIWKEVFTVTFDGANSKDVEDGSKVSSPNSPTQAGKVFQGWYNGEVKYDFSAAVTADLALTSKWADADPNHYVYAYNDDFHFDGVVYKTPEGKVDNNDGESNKAITTPYTLFSGAQGITSIVATKGIYDSKGTHVNAFLKINTSGDSKLQITVATGYTAELKMKMGSWNVGDAAPTTTMKDPSNETIYYTGTMSGKAEDHSYAELTYTLASAGTYTLTTATKTLFISNIDLVATPINYTVTMAQEGGAEATISGNQNNKHYGDEITVTAEEVVGYNFVGWTASPAVTFADNKALSTTFTMPNSDVTVTATFSAINYAVTLAAGTNAKTAGEANIDYDATALTITAAPTGTGTLQGFYTATTASDETKVANADGTLVNDDVTGYVTDGKWSCAGAATLYAVYDGVPTAIDNTADEIKAVKVLENGQLFIRRGVKVYTITGELVK